MHFVRLSCLTHERYRVVCLNACDVKTRIGMIRQTLFLFISSKKHFGILSLHAQDILWSTECKYDRSGPSTITIAKNSIFQIWMNYQRIVNFLLR